MHILRSRLDRRQGRRDNELPGPENRRDGLPTIPTLTGVELVVLLLLNRMN